VFSRELHTTGCSIAMEPHTMCSIIQGQMQINPPSSSTCSS
jgi:hypothetical protein